MSASQGPRGPGGRGRAVRGRGALASRGSSSHSGAKSRFVATDPTHRTRPPPMQNGFRNSSRKSSPSSKYQFPNNKAPLHTQRTSTSPPADAAARTSDVPLHKRIVDVYQKLKRSREQERKDAIRNGFLADPDKPTSLANAITPVGTCQDMCPQYERVERVVQLMVDNNERTTASSGKNEPDEKKMVKRFRRSAAGYDEQLPSDIRPPLILKHTLDYLIEEVIGGPQPLANVHKFVWDRTRCIRNDFSIQQVTKIEDLRIAINCFERIARFHILSLHQLSQPDRDNLEFDHHQEREQLNNTLLSLMYYYDDSRHMLTSPNEAEFRAYCIIFEIQDQRPDLEDRAQQWPRSLLQDQRVQTAFKLYAAAGNTSDEQGPLRPRAAFAIAQANPGRFWDLVSSSAVSYIMACVAEIYFDLVRKTRLEAIWKGYRGKRGGAAKIEDWGLQHMTGVLGFDDEQQLQTYVEEHGFSIGEREDGEAYIDLGSVVSRHLTDSNPRRKQIHSKSLVEHKRLGRTMPAIINGVSASDAQSQGAIEDTSDAERFSVSHEDRLFVSEDSDEGVDYHSQSTKTEKASKPSRTTSVTPSESATATKPTFPISNVNANPSSATKSTSVGNFSASDTTGTDPSPFSTNKPSMSFGKPSGSVTSTSVPSHNAGPSPAIAEEQPQSQDESSNLTNGKEPYPSRVERSLLLNSPQPLAASSSLPHQAAMPTFGTSTSFPNSMHNAASEIGNSQHPNPGDAKVAGLRSSTATGNVLELQKPFIPCTTNTFMSNKPTVTPTTYSVSKSTPEPSSRVGLSFTTPLSSTLTTASAPPFMAAENQAPASSTTNIKPSPLLTTDTLELSKPLASPESSQNTFVSAPPSQSGPDVGASSAFPRKGSLASPIAMDNGSVDEQGPTLDSGPERFPSKHSINFDQKKTLIEALSEAVMHDDGGLLQQFVEYMVRPLIVNSVREMKDEQSWNQAKLCRSVLLTKKYGRIWKRNAWKSGLLRKGIERRNNLANSMRELAQSQRQGRLKSRISAGEVKSDISIGHSGKTLSNKPDENLHLKRKSLPANLGEEQSRLTGVENSSNKRMRFDAPGERFGNSQRQNASHHECSKTVATRSPFHDSDLVKSSATILNGTLIDRRDTRTLRQSGHQTARALLRGRTDTTRTDYFRLKALGLDPNTPLVPRTIRKRPRAEEALVNEKRPRTSLSSSASYSPPFKSDSENPLVKQGTIPTQSLQPRDTFREDRDSEEALLSQMHTVRETMLSDIAWFQAERAKSQLTSNSEAEQPLNETAKEQRLREFARTPSRTEKRLRESGARGLLPKGWNSNSSWRDESGKISTATASPWGDFGPATGFSPPGSSAASPALDATGTHTGSKTVAREAGRAKRTAARAAGTSVEDAIEL